MIYILLYLLVILFLFAEMKQWLRSKLLSKWLHVAGAAVSAGSIGYTTAIYQRQQENKLLVHIGNIFI